MSQCYPDYGQESNSIYRAAEESEMPLCLEHLLKHVVKLMVKFSLSRLLLVIIHHKLAKFNLFCLRKCCCN